MFGYLLGVGDRHISNMLIHQHTGELIHIDFDRSYDYCKDLDIPETVPFRLTQNMTDVFGCFGESGTFKKCAELALTVLKRNKDLFLSCVNAFTRDKLKDVNNKAIDFSRQVRDIERKLLGIN